jgi:hypothetical protein
VHFHREPAVDHRRDQHDQRHDDARILLERVRNPELDDDFQRQPDRVGNLSYTVAANTTTAARNATLLVAGRNVISTQGAPTPPVAPQGLKFVGGAAFRSRFSAAR